MSTEHRPFYCPGCGERFNGRHDDYCGIAYPDPADDGLAAAYEASDDPDSGEPVKWTTFWMDHGRGWVRIEEAEAKLAALRAEPQPLREMLEKTHEGAQGWCRRALNLMDENERLREAVRRADAVIGQCDCVMDGDGSNREKKAWFATRDRAANSLNRKDLERLHPSVRRGLGLREGASSLDARRAHFSKMHAEGCPARTPGTPWTLCGCGLDLDGDDRDRGDGMDPPGSPRPKRPDVS